MSLFVKVDRVLVGKFPILPFLATFDEKKHFRTLFSDTTVTTVFSGFHRFESVRYSHVFSVNSVNLVKLERKREK